VFFRHLKRLFLDTRASRDTSFPSISSAGSAVGLLVCSTSRLFDVIVSNRIDRQLVVH